MRKLIVLSVLSFLMTGCSQFNEPGAPCGQFGEQCLYKVPVNR